MFTAKITGVGADSMVPDNPGAVDAVIFYNDKLVGEVTLLPSEDTLVCWGDLEHWASSQLQDWLTDRCSDEHGWFDQWEFDSLCDDVVKAVRSVHDA